MDVGSNLELFIFGHQLLSFSEKEKYKTGILATVVAVYFTDGSDLLDGIKAGLQFIRANSKKKYCRIIPIFSV